MRTALALLLTLLLTGCATSGPRPERTELELKKIADHRACRRQTLGYAFLPMGELVSKVEFAKCMEKRGWDVLSARDRMALFGTTEFPAPTSESK